MPDSGPENGVRALSCRGCGYELTGLGAGMCPECGRWFDPSDPTTVWDAVSRRRAVRRQRLKITVALLSVLVFAFLVAIGVVPRPALGQNGGIQPGLWVWLGKGYGVQRIDTGLESLRVHRWGSRVSRIDGLDMWSGPTPRRRWTLERLGPDRWRMDVADVSVDFGSLLLAFNTMRTDEELFGVAIGPDRQGGLAAPFEVEGTRVDMLAAMIDRFGLSIQPMQLSPTDREVWVMDPDTGRLSEVSIERAVELGYQVRPVGMGGVGRIEMAR